MLIFLCVCNQYWKSGKKHIDIAIFIDNDHLEKLSFRFFLAILLLLVSLLTEVGSESFLLLQCLTVPVLVWFCSQVWPRLPRDLEVCWPVFFLIVTTEQQEDVTWEDEELLQLVVGAFTTELLTSEPLMTGGSVWRLCCLVIPVNIVKCDTSLWCCNLTKNRVLWISQCLDTKQWTSVPGAS